MNVDLSETFDLDLITKVLVERIKKAITSIILVMESAFTVDGRQIVDSSSLLSNLSKSAAVGIDMALCEDMTSWNFVIAKMMFGFSVVGASSLEGSK